MPSTMSSGATYLNNAQIHHYEPSSQQQQQQQQQPVVHHSSHQHAQQPQQRRRSPNGYNPSAMPNPSGENRQDYNALLISSSNGVASTYDNFEYKAYMEDNHSYRNPLFDPAEIETNDDESKYYDGGPLGYGAQRHMNYDVADEVDHYGHHRYGSGEVRSHSQKKPEQLMAQQHPTSSGHQAQPPVVLRRSFHGLNPTRREQQPENIDSQQQQHYSSQHQQPIPAHLHHHQFIAGNRCTTMSCPLMGNGGDHESGSSDDAEQQQKLHRLGCFSSERRKRNVNSDDNASNCWRSSSPSSPPSQQQQQQQQQQQATVSPPLKSPTENNNAQQLRQQNELLMLLFNRNHLAGNNTRNGVDNNLLLSARHKNLSLSTTILCGRNATTSAESDGYGGSGRWPASSASTPRSGSFRRKQPQCPVQHEQRRLNPSAGSNHSVNNLSPTCSANLAGGAGASPSESAASSPNSPLFVKQNQLLLPKHLSTQPTHLPQPNAMRPLRRCRSASPAVRAPLLCPEQQNLIRKSWQRVSKTTVARSIREHLVAKCSASDSTRFFGDDPNGVCRHERYFVELTQSAVDNLTDMETALRPWLETIGHGHMGFAITSRHWDAFGESLIFAITNWIGPGKAHRETVKAWRLLVSYIADRLGASSALIQRNTGGCSGTGSFTSASATTTTAASTTPNNGEPSQSQSCCSTPRIQLLTLVSTGPSTPP